MTTIRAYTTIEQSRKLAEILPLESADMFYTTNRDWEGHKVLWSLYNDLKKLKGE